MKVGLFLWYKVCQIPSLFSEAVPDLKMGFYNLAVFMVFLALKSEHIAFCFWFMSSVFFSWENNIKLVQWRISVFSLLQEFESHLWLLVKECFKNKLMKTKTKYKTMESSPHACLPPPQIISFITSFKNKPQSLQKSQI